MLRDFALDFAAGVAMVAALALLAVGALAWVQTREAWRPIWWTALALTALAPVHWVPGLIGAVLVVLMLVVTAGGVAVVAGAAAREARAAERRDQEPGGP